MHVIFDVSRLLRRTRRRTPGGIDRTDLAWATHLPQMPVGTSFLLGGERPALLKPRAARRVLVAAADVWTKPPAADDDPAYAQICRWLRQPPASQTIRFEAAEPAGPKPWRNLWLLMARWRDTMSLPRDLAGSVYLNSSHSGLEDARLVALLKARGARIAVLLHDLIPVDRPELGGEAARARHHRRLAAIQAQADLVLVNSRDTGARFNDWCEARGQAAPRVRLAPLGVDASYLDRAALRPPAAALPYFVCVGTIGPRKNLALLVAAWRQLAATLGEQCPRLVVAGRRGEDGADLDGAGPAVAAVEGLGDPALASLIAGAHGVLQPSFAEGFGLPLAEAQALGVAVLASDIPAHREIARAPTRLLDPLHTAPWLAAIAAMAARPPQRGPARPATTWGQHVEAGLATMEQLW